MTTDNDPQRRPYSDMTGAVANLEEALAMLRSAGEVASRKGQDTNWSAFYAGIEKALTPFGLRPISPRTYRLPNVEQRDPSEN